MCHHENSKKQDHRNPSPVQQPDNRSGYSARDEQPQCNEHLIEIQWAVAHGHNPSAVAHITTGNSI
jgi:hypothetical protein